MKVLFAIYLPKNHYLLKNKHVPTASPEEEGRKEGQSSPHKFRRKVLVHCCQQEINRGIPFGKVMWKEFAGVFFGWGNIFLVNNMPDFLHTLIENNKSN